MIHPCRCGHTVPVRLGTSTPIPIEEVPCGGSMLHICMEGHRENVRMEEHQKELLRDACQERRSLTVHTLSRSTGYKLQCSWDEVAGARFSLRFWAAIKMAAHPRHPRPYQSHHGPDCRRPVRRTPPRPPRASAPSPLWSRNTPTALTRATGV